VLKVELFSLLSLIFNRNDTTEKSWQYTKCRSLIFSYLSFSSGTRNSGDILIYDVRQKDCIIKFQSHRQEICGLKWCPNGRYLASGSNDNTVCVWDFHQWYSNSGTSGSVSSLLPPVDEAEKKSNIPTKPLWHFKDHKAAVKVMTFNLNN
jgi:WD40 repeat protein